MGHVYTSGLFQTESIPTGKASPPVYLTPSIFIYIYNCYSPQIQVCEVPKQHYLLVSSVFPNFFAVNFPFFGGTGDPLGFLGGPWWPLAFGQVLYERQASYRPPWRSSIPERGSEVWATTGGMNSLGFMGIHGNLYEFMGLNGISLRLRFAVCWDSWFSQWEIHYVGNL